MGLRRHHCDTLSPSVFRSFDEYLLAVLGEIDGCQHGIGKCGTELGHGRSVFKVSN